MKVLESLSPAGRSVFLIAALLLLPFISPHGAENAPTKPGKAVKPYPLDVCLASGEAFGGDMGEPYVLVENGQEIKLCCKSCLKDFNRDKQALLAKVTEANKRVKPYKLTACVVSGEKFGGTMGEPVVLVYKNQEFKLCCKDCLGDFKKDKDGYLKKVAAMSEKK